MLFIYDLRNIEALANAACQKLLFYEILTAVLKKRKAAFFPYPRLGKASLRGKGALVGTSLFVCKQTEFGL